MQHTSSLGSRTRTISTLRQLSSIVIEILIVVLAASFIGNFVAGGENFLFLLPAWALLSTIYIVGGCITLFLASCRDIRQPAARLPRGLAAVSRALSWVMPICAALVGIFAAVLLVLSRGFDVHDLLSDVETLGGVDEETLKMVFTQLLIVLPGVAIVISWFMLQIAYANIYRHVDEAHSDEQGLDFPRASNENRAPTLLDYLYFSFTVGSSFAASDVTVQSQRMRWLVLVHNVLSYFYNAGVVAIAITTLTSLKV